MYSYNLKQLKMLNILVTKKEWAEAFEYVGYYGLENAIEVSRITSLGILDYASTHLLSDTCLDNFDSALNYLCTLHDLRG